MRVDMDANDRQLQAVYNDFASFFSDIKWQKYYCGIILRGNLKRYAFLSNKREPHLGF